jgi:hypothetical protein
MPMAGLSLVGFMDQGMAEGYLKRYCLLADSWKKKGAESHWKAAKARLGPRIEGAGAPEVEGIPSQHEAHLNAIRALPRFQATVGRTNPRFQVVNIPKLFAWQFGVVTENKASAACAALSPDAPLEQLLPLCLPTAIDDPAVDIHEVEDGFVIESTDVNTRVIAGSLQDMPDLRLHGRGAAFGAGNPWVHVACFEGKYYLSNGYHRAAGLLKAKITRMPCLVQDVSDFKETGAKGEGASFERSQFCLDNPPTCGHFAPDRAYPVAFRKMKRRIEITWKQEFDFLE